MKSTGVHFVDKLRQRQLWPALVAGASPTPA
jgi:hypothetical protein